MKSSPAGLVQPAAINRRRAVARIAAAGIALPLAATPASGGPVQSSTHALADHLTRYTTGASRHKERAAADYRTNMARFGGQLASPSDGLWGQPDRGTPWQFDVLIIGSGYGAAITAARLAQRKRAGTRIAIVERGREWMPGSFPDNVQDMIGASRNRLFVQKDEVRNPLGLYNVRQFNEISVFSGSGLGGSSLINANVAIRPDVDVFQQSVWPEPLRDRMFLDPYYDLAEWELGTVRESSDWTDKMRAQRLAAERLRDCGAHFEAAALTVMRGPAGGELPIINRQGMLQRACIGCGDCLTGCNVGAKNTLAMNYLPLARTAGAEMYPQTTVHHIDKCQGYYRVHAQYFPAHSLSKREAVPLELTARVVIVAAGSLGSTEILLRSASPSLELSRQLGRRWTGNGDALGFIQRTQCRTGVGGFGAYETGQPPVGPTVQTNITYPARAALAQRVLVQDGAATRAYVNALTLLMHDLDLDHTQILLGMGHDGAEGCITLENDNARLDWPGLTESRYRELIRNEFRRIAEAHGGEYRYLRVFGDRMISVHPLGGCAMGQAADTGVVNHKCQVFDAAAGGDVDAVTGQPRVHAGLYVCDGSTMPTSIACNPLLTISAMAERTAELMALEPEYRDLFHPIAQFT